jgi:hypothetical protein
MKQIGLVTLISVAASAAAPVTYTRADAATFATTKSVEQFGGCFVAAQERARRAWSYVPRDNGGTFSNLGARGARGLYFLAVSDRGAAREIRLETAAKTDSAVAKAIDQCV